MTDETRPDEGRMPSDPPELRRPDFRPAGERYALEDPGHDPQDGQPLWTPSAEDPQDGRPLWSPSAEDPQDGQPFRSPSAEAPPLPDPVAEYSQGARPTFASPSGWGDPSG